MDEQGLSDAEREVLAEQQPGQGEGEGTGERAGEGAGEGEGARPSRFDQRIAELVAQRKAADQRAETAERGAADARAAAEAAERIARQKSGPTDLPDPNRFPADADAFTQRGWVSARFSEGRITDDQRVTLLVDIAAEEKLAKYRGRDEARQVLTSVGDEIEGWKHLAPEINQPGSALNGRVAEAYRRLVARGYSEDIRTQLTAVESVMGWTLSEARQRRSVDDFTSDSIPRGGVGTGGPGGGGSQGRQTEGNRGDQLFRRLTPEALAAMRELYGNSPDADARIKDDLKYADEETLTRRGRLKVR